MTARRTLTSSAPTAARSPVLTGYRPRGVGVVADQPHEVALEVLVHHDEPGGWLPALDEGRRDLLGMQHRPALQHQGVGGRGSTANPAPRRISAARAMSRLATSSRVRVLASRVVPSSSSMSRPSCRMPIRVATRATSDSRWLDSRTVTPSSRASVDEELADLDHTGRVQAVDRLVQHQDPRPVQQRLGQPEPLCVAQRQRARLRPGIGRRARTGATASSTTASLREPAQSPGDLEVLADRQVRVGRRGLDQVADLAPTPNGPAPGARPPRASRSWVEPSPAASGSAWSCPPRSGRAARRPRRRPPPGVTSSTAARVAVPLGHARAR